MKGRIWPLQNSVLICRSPRAFWERRAWKGPKSVFFEKSYLPSPEGFRRECNIPIYTRLWIAIEVSFQLEKLLKYLWLFKNCEKTKWFKPFYKSVYPLRLLAYQTDRHTCIHFHQIRSFKKTRSKKPAQNERLCVLIYNKSVALRAFHLNTLEWCRSCVLRYNKSAALLFHLNYTRMVPFVCIWIQH